MARVELAPFERRHRQNAFSVANLFYGGRIQFTLGKWRFYAAGELGARLGKLGVRAEPSAEPSAEPVEAWSLGIELASATLYRPSGHRLEFSVIEDDARFIGGRLQKNRQTRLSYRWSVNE